MTADIAHLEGKAANSGVTIADLEPLLLQYKVDIAFWGHIHFAQLSCPMYAGGADLLRRALKQTRVADPKKCAEAVAKMLLELQSELRDGAGRRVVSTGRSRRPGPDAPRGGRVEGMLSTRNPAGGSVARMALTALVADAARLKHVSDHSFGLAISSGGGMSLVEAEVALGLAEGEEVPSTGVGPRSVRRMSLREGRRLSGRSKMVLV